MTLDERLRRAAEGIADRVEAPYVDLGAVRAGARARTRRTQAAVLAVVVVMIALTGVAIEFNRNAGSLEPVAPPGVPGSGPVWYDAAGLHHGDVVEQTAVDLYDGEGGDGEGGDLALVRTGALYRDPATSDVWFHPWAGEPRIVGRNSLQGPGGDPNGDVAVWFDEDELVVYDTASGLVVSRTLMAPRAVVASAGGDHVHGGNTFRQVSDQQVVWDSDGAVQRLDLVTGVASVLWQDSIENDSSRVPQDFHDDVVVWGGPGGLEITGSGREDPRPADLEGYALLSADGTFALAPWEADGGDSHGVAIADVSSDEVWKLPGPKFYGYVAWSYDHVALVRVDRAGQRERLLACLATTRTCDRLPYEGDVVLPTS